MSAREAIDHIRKIMQATIADMQSGRVCMIQAGHYLACLQANLRRLQAETIEL